MEVGAPPFLKTDIYNKQPMKRRLFFFSILLYFGNIVYAQDPGLVKYVITRQGTNSKYEFSYGNTYPATALPFGMNTWTPQTGKNGDGWKYQYFVHTIRGFQQSHQCSSWVNDYAVFSLIPVTCKLVGNENERAASFIH